MYIYTPPVMEKQLEKTVIVEHRTETGVMAYGLPSHPSLYQPIRYPFQASLGLMKANSEVTWVE